MRVTVNYQPVRVRRTKTGKCPISPFNKNPDGTIRTPEQAFENVQRLADKWVPDFTHDGCLL